MRNKFARKFTALQINTMRELFKANYSLGYISRKFDCKTNAVWNNVFDLSNHDLTEGKKKCAKSSSKLTDEQVQSMRLLAKRGDGSCVLAKMFKISQSAALGVIKGKTYRRVPGWIRLKRNLQFVYHEPSKQPQEEIKSDKCRGTKLGSKRLAKSGEVLKMAKKYNVSKSTICKWRDKGLIKI